jgi:hypothetical protein
MSYILIIGGGGNMGRRYAAIIESLGRVTRSLELGHDENEFFEAVQGASGVLIATPTDTHMDIIGKVAACKLRVPILCEKPLMRGDPTVALEQLQKAGVNLQMVDQYLYMPRHGRDRSDDKGTVYESIFSGNDGLAWDCINLIGKARDLKQVRLKLDESVIWTCKINGYRLNIDDMPAAYQEMIFQWLDKPEENYVYTRNAHRRVLEYIKQCSGNKPS